MYKKDCKKLLILNEICECMLLIFIPTTKSPIKKLLTPSYLLENVDLINKLVGIQFIFNKIN
jgi:hypothetical protein